MIVVLPTVFALGVLLLWALYAEEVEPDPGGRPAPPWPTSPTPADVARPRFPFAPLGYDRARVDQHLQRAAELVADLQARLAEAESAAAPPRAASPPPPHGATPPPHGVLPPPLPPPGPDASASPETDPSV